jgi:hypothetical protein
MICSSVNDIDEEPRALGNSVSKRRCESTDPAGDHVNGCNDSRPELDCGSHQQYSSNGKRTADRC